MRKLELSALQRFGLAAALWLPFAFFVWFYFAPGFVWPVAQLAKFAFLHGWPKLFLDVVQGVEVLGNNGQVTAFQTFAVQIDTNVVFNVAAAGQPLKLAYYDFPLNPMVYGYSIPLFAGLVMATPLEKWRRFAQIAGGVAILWLVQTFGVVAEAFMRIGINGPAEGTAAVQQLGYSLEAIALAYQFGYLILPPLVPAVVWIVCNRSFIEELTLRTNEEPRREVDVQAGNSGNP